MPPKIIQWSLRQGRRLPGYVQCKKAFCGNKFIFLCWVIASAIVTIALPASTLIEFWHHDPASGENQAVELMKIYPHMILVPPMMQWAVLWILGSALSLAWDNLPKKDRRPRRRMRVVSFAAAGIALVLLGGELIGSPVMLLELSPRGDARASWEKLYVEHRNLLQPPATNDATAQNALKSRQAALRHQMQYDQWKGRRHWSVTRVFYAATFFVSMFTIASLYMGLAYAKDLPNERIRNRFITLLVATAASYALWFPPRFYFNSQIKGVVFGAIEAAPGRDVILCLTLAAFGVAALILHYRYLEMVKNIAGVATAIVAPLAAFFTAPFLGGLIGLSSGPFQWVYVFIFIATTFFIYSRILADD